MLMLILLAAGCDRDCKDDVVETYYMPDSQKAMVPYETGDTLVFLYEQNAQKDTITFTGKKERKFEENSELINDCPRYRTEKYEQLHYNFYSKDKAHHLKVVNDSEWKEVNIIINSIKKVVINLEHLNDQSRINKTININKSTYDNVYKGYDIDFLYNNKHGLLKYKNDSMKWSILNHIN
jgi:hypothetical protein